MVERERGTVTNLEIDELVRDARLLGENVKDMAEALKDARNDLALMRTRIRDALDAFDIADANTETETAEQAVNRMRDAMISLRRALS